MVSGKLSRDIWTEVPGRFIKEFKDSPRVYDVPDVSDLIASAATPVDWGDNYAQRLRGTVTAPVTGEYTFWLSSDDSSELWLSDNALPYRKRLIASVGDFTAVEEWDKNLDQKSAKITLVAGQKYYLELWHKDGSLGDHVSIAWEAPGTSREVIPSEYLQSYCPVFVDQDRDGLPSDWEAQYGFDPEALEADDLAPTADPDGDGFINRLEALNGTDPTEADVLPGYVIAERWNGVTEYNVSDLKRADKYFGEPDFKRAIGDVREIDITNYSGTRMRGYLCPPETGTYFFWISARDGAELWISPDSSKYLKQRVAVLGGEFGTGHGVIALDGNRWDQFTSQMSDPVELVAGQKYFFELIGQTNQNFSNHLSVAWASPSGIREPLPFSFMVPYSHETEDNDDDYLPDAWEVQYALSSEDNGGTDRDREGENGDFDGDGLTNREEYLLGTLPNNVDSDGDGLSDLVEYQVYGTNPSVSDSSEELVVATVAPNSVAGLGVGWIQTGSGVLTSSFRGKGEWNFSVPQDGFWILQISSALRGDVRNQDDVPVHISVDGHSMGRSTMIFRSGLPGSLRILTPYLQSGTHSLELFIDNYTARRSVEVTAIKVIQPGGVDANGNGIPDATEQVLAGRSRIHDRLVFSHISPAFVEGRALNPNLVDLTAINRSGQQGRVRYFNQGQWDRMLPQFEQRLERYAERLQRQMRLGHGRMEGFQLTHGPGPGSHTWYSRVDLPRNEAIGYVAQFDGLGTYDHQMIAWTPYNVLDGGVLEIPVGSKLLMGAWIRDWDWRTVTLFVDGQSYNFQATESHVHEFTQSGTYEIYATHPEGQSGLLTIHVRDAQLPDGMAVGENTFVDFQFPAVAPNLSLDSDGEIRIENFSSYGAGGDGSQVDLGGKFPGVYRMAARLGQGGIILDQKEVAVVGVSDGLRNNSDSVTSIGEDLYLVQSPLLITHLPSDATVEITIFAGGVTFPDGTTQQTLTGTDFDEYGVTMLGFHVPAELLRAPCHYIRIYDGNGKRIY